MGYGLALLPPEKKGTPSSFHVAPDVMSLTQWIVCACVCCVSFAADIAAGAAVSTAIVFEVDEWSIEYGSPPLLWLKSKRAWYNAQPTQVLPHRVIGKVMRY